MKSSIQSNLAFALPLTVMALVVFAIVGQSYSVATRVLYPIDDPYIHLAMARHFAEHGLWGVSLAGFSASSSSPGWTALLASGFYLFGSQEWLPLALNMAAGLALIWLFCVYLIHQQWHWAAAGATATLVCFVLPLPALVCLGMEHTVHVLFAALLAYLAARQQTESPDSSPSLLFCTAAVATAFRFETVFVVAPLALMFIARKQWKTALGATIFSALPIVVMGAIQLANGWEFFPASIVRKSVLGQAGLAFYSQLYTRLFGQLFNTGHLLVPYVLCLVVFWRKSGRPWSQERVLSGVYLCAALLHCAAASIGWFYRYEAYLLAIAFLALAPLGPELWQKWKTLASESSFTERWTLRALALAAAILLTTPYVWNASSIAKIAPGSTNLFQQQYQMGLFLREYYQGETVAANDIGAINFLADIRCLDGMGLGSREPSLAAQRGRLNADFIDTWARQEQAAIAVIYENWWDGRLPASWIKMGEWTVDQKVSVAEPTVSFYATAPLEAERLYACLKQFTPRLPDGVSVVLAEKDVPAPTQ